MSFENFTHSQFFSRVTHEHERFAIGACCVVFQNRCPTRWRLLLLCKNGYRSRFSLSRTGTAELQFFTRGSRGPTFWVPFITVYLRCLQSTASCRISPIIITNSKILLSMQIYRYSIYREVNAREMENDKDL